MADPFTGFSEEESEFDRKQRLRRQGVEALQGIATGYEEDLTRIGEAAKAGEANIRAGAARSLAAGLSQGGGYTSGANLAAARQASLEGGLAQAQYAAGTAERMAAARKEAAGARYEALVGEAEAGSLESQRNEKRRTHEADIQAIFKANKGTFNDDEDAAAAAITRLAESEEDPVIKAELLYRAKQVRRGNEDF